jgi:hypothetical protein
VKAVIKLLRENPKFRKFTFIFLSLYYVFAFIFIAINSFPQFRSLENPEVILVAPFGVLLLINTLGIIQASPVRDALDLQGIIDERKEITSKLEGGNEFDILDTIRLNLNQLNEYYTINKNQAKSSFRFSILAIILGLATIITGIWLYYYGSNPNISATFLTSAAGLLSEFIGGVSFFVYRKSLEQANLYFNKLIRVQDTMLAINLSKNIGAKDKEMELIERIVDSLLKRSLE